MVWSVRSRRNQIVKAGRDVAVYGASDRAKGVRGPS